MTKQRLVEVLVNLQSEARDRCKTELKGFFGSYARGDQGTGSNVNALVEFGRDADLFDFVGLPDFLEERFTDRVKEEYKSAPWKEMAGIRDRLIRLYFWVDYYVVWKTIKNRLPALKAPLMEVFAKGTFNG